MLRNLSPNLAKSVAEFSEISRKMLRNPSPFFLKSVAKCYEIHCKLLQGGAASPAPSGVQGACGTRPAPEKKNMPERGGSLFYSFWLVIPTCVRVYEEIKVCFVQSQWVQCITACCSGYVFLAWKLTFCVLWLLVEPYTHIFISIYKYIYIYI